jgi:FkbM family methyltransferase
MSLMQPIRYLTRKLGLYRRLHALYVYLLIRKSGTRVLFRKDKVYELVKGDRVIRYDNWNMAFFMAETFDAYFAAAIPVQEGKQQVVDYTKPGWRKLPKSGMEFYFHGVAEPEIVTELYLKHAGLGPGDVVLDMGAYNGTQSVMFGLAVGPTGRVFAFEPDPTSFDALSRNLERHHSSNVTPVQAGVWSETGVLTFYSDASESSSFVFKNEHGHKEIKVPVVEPGDFLAKQGLDRLDVVKMDIEGAELTVLKSMVPLLQKHKPNLIIEPHFIDRKPLLPDLVSLLEGLGYQCEVVSQGKTEYYSDWPLLCAKHPSRQAAMRPT